jgi:integrase
VALAYAAHLKEQREAGRASLHYTTDQYAGMRRFFAFAIDEGLETAPARNPFGLRDIPRRPDMIPRYLADGDVRALLDYCAQGASLRERTLVVTLLHTGIRAAELAALKASDLVELQGVWKLHIHEGKGLKDRLIPLTAPCLAALRAWQEQGWERSDDHLFTWHGRPWRSSGPVTALISTLGQKLGIVGLTAHRFRHTFAVALLNYGIRESALQKLMGHATLGMTLEYARILDHTVEQSFSHAVAQMQTGPLSWVPSFFGQEEFTLFAEGDAVSYIRLPHGYCRRNPKLHCESDVKCLLCERYAATATDLPRLREMHERFVALGLQLKADVVAAQIGRLQAPVAGAFIPLSQVTVAPRRGGASPCSAP